MKAKFVLKPANNSFQNLEVNFTSISNTIFFGTPCKVTTSMMNTYSTSLLENVDFIGMKCVILVNFSTMTMMESCYFTIFDNPVMKIVEITSHFHSQIKIGCNSPPGCL